MATYKLVDSEKLEADLTTVADAIRAKTGGEEPLSFPEGMAGEVDAVFEAGKKSEWDAFWDMYQESGKRYNYAYGFSGIGWNNDTFKPKYSMRPTTAGNMFANTNLSGDFDKILNRVGVSLDLSKASTISSCFASATQITKLGTVDTTSASDLSSVFYNMQLLETIEKLVLKEDGTQSFSQTTFGLSPNIKNIVIEGTIGSNCYFSANVNLSKESIRNIVDTLSADVTGRTVQLSLAAVNTAFETSTGAADGSTSEEWATLIATKPNWTISLA